MLIFKRFLAIALIGILMLLPAIVLMSFIYRFSHIPLSWGSLLFVTRVIIIVEALALSSLVVMKNQLGPLKSSMICFLTTASVILMIDLTTFGVNLVTFLTTTFFIAITSACLVFGYYFLERRVLKIKGL
jgi:hypothetical protein